MQRELSITPAMMEKGSRFIFHYDGGHGWLEVKESDLIILGVSEKITHYSYKNEGNAYLEEDCDMAKFLSAFIENFSLCRKEIDFNKMITEVYDGNFSPIRNYQKYIL